MVIRDADILADMSHQSHATVYVSVPTVDERAWAALEPGTAHPLQRLRAVRHLRDAGVHVGVLMAPIVPGFMSDPKQLEATIKAIADHGARFVGCNVMFLEGGTREHFVRWLEATRPELVGRYRNLYARKYAASPYRREVHDVFDALREKYGLNRREEEGERR